MTCECCDNRNSWSFGDPVLHHPKWIQNDLLKPITLSLSSHTIQSVKINPWRHWNDPQTNQVNKCPDVFRKCPTGTKLRIARKNPRKANNPLEPPHTVDGYTDFSGQTNNAVCDSPCWIEWSSYTCGSWFTLCVSYSRWRVQRLQRSDKVRPDEIVFFFSSSVQREE